VDQGGIELDKLKGSWAGALGQVQFLPSSYLSWAVDFDEDGKRDIWGSLPDVLASIANYLRGHGWRKGVPYGYRVTVPEPAATQVAAVALRGSGCRAVRDLSEPRTLEEWKAMGLTLKGGQPLPRSTRPASLLHIDTRAWLVTENYEALLAYNCAHTYALSVVALAERLPRH
jgi:membrane-bound lytic murein transglycosylase B